MGTRKPVRTTSDSSADLDPVTEPRLQAAKVHTKTTGSLGSVSIVLANYTTVQQLSDALESIQSQSVGLCDTIMVGCSQEVEEAAVERIENLTLFEEAIHAESGVDPRLRALEAARSNVIAFLEPYDSWSPDHLEVALAAFDEDSQLGLTIAKQNVDPLRVDGCFERHSAQTDFCGPLSPYRSEECDRGLIFDSLQYPILSLSCIVARTAMLATFTRRHGFLLGIARTEMEDLARWELASKLIGIRLLDEGTSITCARGSIFYKRYVWPVWEAKRERELERQKEQSARAREQRIMDLAWEYAMVLARAGQPQGPADEGLKNGGQDKTIPSRLQRLAGTAQVWVPILFGSYMASYGYLRTQREGGDSFMAAFCFALFGILFWALATWALDLMHLAATKFRRDGDRLARRS